MFASDWLQIALAIYFFLRRGIVFVASRLPHSKQRTARTAIGGEAAEGAD